MKNNFSTNMLKYTNFFKYAVIPKINIISIIHFFMDSLLNKLLKFLTSINILNKKYENAY